MLGGIFRETLRDHSGVLRRFGCLVVIMLSCTATTAIAGSVPASADGYCADYVYWTSDSVLPASYTTVTIDTWGSGYSEWPELVTLAVDHPGLADTYDSVVSVKSTYEKGPNYYEMYVTYYQGFPLNVNYDFTLRFGYVSSAEECSTPAPTSSS